MKDPVWKMKQVAEWEETFASHISGKTLKYMRNSQNSTIKKKIQLGNGKRHEVTLC